MLVLRQIFELMTRVKMKMMKIMKKAAMLMIGQILELSARIKMKVVIVMRIKH